MKAQQDRFNLEVVAVKSKLQEVQNYLRKNNKLKIQAMNPVLKERFSEAREELRNLNISEERYLQLKALPEDHYSFQDFVLVQVFELNEKHRLQRDQLQFENATLR
jgi:progesterone-induced-blocking factor 1